jgi:hypothetical protein
MSLRDAMLCGRVARRSFQGTKRSLTGYAAFKLPLNFLCGPLFERVSATAQSQACDREQDRHAFHLRIL